MQPIWKAREYSVAGRLKIVPLTTRTAMPGPSYVTVRPMTMVTGSMQRSWRLGATFFVAFGVLALIVAAVGLYGVIAYNVSQRMVDANTPIGLVEISGVQTMSLRSEMGQFNPHLRAIVALNLDSELLGVTRMPNAMARTR